MSEHFVIGIEGELTPEKLKALQEQWAQMVSVNPGLLAVMPNQVFERVEKLENLLRPFAEAFRLHLRDERRVNELKTVMAKDTSVEEWRAAYVELYGEVGQVPVSVEET